MLTPSDLLLASGNPLQDPMILLVIIICIILIILSAIIGTILGRKKKAEVEARIAERKKQRRAIVEEAAQRERDMLKRYDDAKKKAEAEMISNPRPVLPPPEIREEEYRPLPRGGERVEMISTTGPRYMKIQGELGVKGSAPVRLSTKENVGVQGTRTTDTGATQSAKAAKAKPVAATKPGPPKPATVVAKPVVAKVEEPPKPEPEKKKEEEKPAKKPAEEEDKGVDQIQEMLSNLEDMKK